MRTVDKLASDDYLGAEVSTINRLFKSTVIEFDFNRVRLMYV